MRRGVILLRLRCRIILALLWLGVATIIAGIAWGAEMQPGTTIQWDCADPTVIEFRGVSGCWVWDQIEHDVCHDECSVATVEDCWKHCLTDIATYLKCQPKPYTECDPLDPDVCWTIENWHCPGFHIGIPPARYYDVHVGGSLTLYVGIDGVSCGPSDGTVPITLEDWPDYLRLGFDE